MATAAALLLAAAVAVILWPRGDDPPDRLLVAASGGGGTAFAVTGNAFGLSARNLGREERRTFEIGDSLFTQNWVTAPSSTSLRDGLGPIQNATACASCHLFDGKAPPPAGPDDPRRGLLLRLSVPDGAGGDRPDPRYGDQIQDRANLGIAPEAQVRIDYAERPGAYGDGERFSLRAPSYRLEALAYGPIAPGVRISPRIASQVVGMGLLEAIPAADIRAGADATDADGDGISGRVNVVPDGRTGAPSLGRFGWKANVASVEDQTAFAFRGDIGVTSTIAPRESCTAAQAACVAAPTGGRPEIADDTLAKVAFYVQTLAVPGRRELESDDVRAGADVFAAAGCEACHTAGQRTAPDAAPAALRGQEFFPFTDLLLHDMGPGLADGRRDGRASGREWRTPPLWGIGLVEEVNGHTNFLHDGRARDLREAILWHAGEGRAAREYFRLADADERDALIAFLESL